MSSIPSTSMQVLEAPPASDASFYPELEIPKGFFDEVKFPNFPNAFNEVNQRASEMGIEKEVCLIDGGEDFVSCAMLTKGGLSCIGLAHDFPLGRPKEFDLRHELAHIKYDDLHKSSPSSFTKGEALVWLYSISVCCLSYASSIYLGCRITKLPSCRSNWSFNCLAGMFGWIGGALSRVPIRRIFRVLPRRSAEIRADREACKYLTGNEKIEAIESMGIFRSLDSPMDLFQEHPSFAQRIKAIWNTFDDEEVQTIKTTWDSLPNEEKRRHKEVGRMLGKVTPFVQTKNRLSFKLIDPSRLVFRLLNPFGLLWENML